MAAETPVLPPAPPAMPQPVQPKSSGGVWSVLVTTGLVGCIVAICMRVQLLEQRILQMEEAAKEEPPLPSFRPIRPPPPPEEEYTPMPEAPAEEEEVKEEGAKEEWDPEALHTADEEEEEEEGVPSE